MLILLLLFLPIYVLLAYKITNNLLSISVIGGAVYLLSSCVAAIHHAVWDIDMNFSAFFSIILSLISLLIGESLGLRCIKVHEMHLVNYNKEDICIRFSRPGMVLSTIFMYFSLAIYYRESLRIASNIGHTGSNLVMANIRLAKSLGERMPSYVSYLYLVAICLAYFYTYVVIYNVVKRKDRIFKYRFEIVNIIAYLGMALLTTGRTELMYYIIYTSAITMMISSLNNSVKLDYKVIRKILIAAFSFFLLFYFIGTFTGKSQRYSPIEGISRYIGGSIAAFSKYMQTNEEQTSTMFGQHTLFGIYSFSNRFLGTDFEILDRPLEFVQIGSTSINIYSAIRRYIQDFGITGCLLIMFIIGLFFGTIEKKASHNTFAMIIYAMMIFVGVELSIEERFFMSIITTGFLYKVVLMYILYNYTERKKGRVKNDYSRNCTIQS